MARLVENLVQAFKRLGLIQRLLDSRRKLSFFSGVSQVVELPQVGQCHLRQNRIRHEFNCSPLVIDLELRFGRQCTRLGAQFEAAVNASNDCGIGMPNIKVNLGEFRHDVRGVTSGGDDMMDSREVGCMLAQ